MPALGAGIITPITLDLLRAWRLKRMGVNKDNIAILGTNKNLYDTLVKRLTETEKRLDARITQCEQLIEENTRLDAEVDNLRLTIADREVKIADRDAKIADRDQKIADRDLKLVERDVIIKDLEKRIFALEEENKRHITVPISVEPMKTLPYQRPRRKPRKGAKKK